MTKTLIFCNLVCLHPLKKRFLLLPLIFFLCPVLAFSAEIRQLRNIGFHSGPISDVAIQSTNQHFWAYSADLKGQIQRWDFHSNQHQVFNLNKQINKISLIPNSTSIVVVGPQGLLAIVDVVAGKVLKEFVSDEKTEYSAISQVSASGWFAVGTKAGSVELWNIVQNSREKRWTGLSWPATTVALTSDFQNVIATSGTKVLAWNIGTDKVVLKIENPENSNPDVSWIERVAIAESGTLFIATHNKVRGFDSFGTEIFSIEVGETAINMLAITNENCCLLTSNFHGALRLWDINQKTLLNTYEDTTRFFVASAFQNKYLVTGTMFQIVELWEID